MARGVVTRTVTGVEVSIKVVDPATEQVVADKIVLNKSKALETPEGMKKAISKALADGKILVSVGEATEINKCYALETSKFMELAHEVDPNTRKATGDADNQ